MTLFSLLWGEEMGGGMGGETGREALKTKSFILKPPKYAGLVLGLLQAIVLSRHSLLPCPSELVKAYMEHSSLNRNPGRRFHPTTPIFFLK